MLMNHLILFGFNSPTLASFTIDNTPLDTPTLASGSFILHIVDFHTG